jgi:hypothetical protein
VSQHTVIQLFDDLDGSPIPDGGGTTISFALDGTSYEIDLTTEHAEALRAALAAYIEAGRKTTATTAGSRRSPARSGSASNPSVVRDWARAQGMPVSDRGRVPASIFEAYDAAH